MGNLGFCLTVQSKHKNYDVVPGLQHVEELMHGFTVLLGKATGPMHAKLAQVSALPTSGDSHATVC